MGDDVGDDVGGSTPPHLLNVCRHTAADVTADDVTHNATVVTAEQPLEDDTDTLGNNDATDGAGVDAVPFTETRSAAEDVEIEMDEHAAADDVAVAVAGDDDERHEADDKDTEAADVDDCGRGEAGEATGRGSDVVEAAAAAAATTSSTSRRSRLRASAAVSPCRWCWGSRSRDRLNPESRGGATTSDSSPETRLATLSGRPSAPPESLMTLSGEHGADEAESLDDRHDSPLLVATLSVLAARS